MHLSRFTRVAIATSALLLIGASCGSDEKSAAPSTEAATEPTDVAIVETTAATDAAADTEPAADSEPTSTDAGSSTATGKPDYATWDANAEDESLAVGERLVIDCAPGGYIGHIYGVGTYASDSSICTAGVFEGIITLESGGPVVAEIAPGLDFYESGEANGVVAENWEVWPRSFTLPPDQVPPAGA